MDKDVVRQVVAANPNFTATRKVSLYSNFGRLQESNPVGYKANVDAWQEVIEEAVRRGAFANSLSFETGPDLIAGFSDPKNGQPMALNTVIDEMVAAKKLVPLAAFTTAKYPVLRSSWAPGQLASNVAFWAVSKIVNTSWRSGDVGKLKPAKYVVVDRLKPVTDNLLRQIKSDYRENGSTFSAGIFSVQQLKEISRLSVDDLEVCLVYLSRETGDLQYDAKLKLVKLEGKIEASDAAVPGIKDVLAKQVIRLSGLDGKIAEYDAKARECLKRGDRERAKQALRGKNALEKTQLQIMEQQNQLELVLSKIDQATDHANMVEALQAGKLLLAERNKAVGGADAINELMDSVQDEIAETDAISEQLAGLSVADVEDELEELEALAKHDTTAERLGALPAAKSKLRTPETEPQPQPERQLAS